MKARAAFIAAFALLAVPATADASAVIDVNCDRVRIDYTQWPSGPPDSSHTSVRVDGGIRFDEVVSFSGSTHRLEVPLNLNDGKQHTIEAKHDWISHDAGSREVDATLTCGSLPPAAPPSPPQEQPPAPPEQPAPPAPTAAGGAPVATDRTGERPARNAAGREPQGEPTPGGATPAADRCSPRQAAGAGAGDVNRPPRSTG